MNNTSPRETESSESALVEDAENGLSKSDATKPTQSEPQQRPIDRLLPEKREQAYIDSRIKDIETAANRSRWVSGFNIALSWLLIAMAYNSIWSWTRLLAERSESMELVMADRTVQKALLEDLLTGWVDSLYFDVPFLGARFGASDAGVIGGVLLALVAIWLFYAARRENHLIFYLVRDSERYRFSEATRRYLKNQLHATQLFAFTGTSDALGPEHMVGALPQARSRTLEAATAAMFAIAPVALGLVLLSDIYSLFLDSPFRAGNDKLVDILIGSCFAAGPTDCSGLITLSVRLVAALAFFSFCTTLMSKHPPAPPFRSGQAVLTPWPASRCAVAVRRCGC